MAGDRRMPLHGPRHNLPLPLNRFIGRERETAEVGERLGRSRLVSLTGPPGIGKTRLALDTGARIAHRYADGVSLVELAPVPDPVLVPETLAAALRVREQPGQAVAQTVIRHLRRRQILLILDNCEHLIEACARLADLLLRSCGEVSILTTSQEPLAIGGELVWRVPSLPVPDPREPKTMLGNEAVQLFCDRAMQIHPDFVLDAETVPAVAEICRRLDGVPLAIELAAARVDVLSPSQIVARLDDRFGLLSGGSRAAMPRHQTLKGALDWSYDLLAVDERVLFRRLSIFAGSFALEAMEEVCGDGRGVQGLFRSLARLVAKSLVATEECRGQVRYRLLQSVRAYARDRLLEAGEMASLASRHLQWVLRLVESTEPALTGPDQLVWLERLETEQDNLRVAFDWAMAEGQTQQALRLAAALTLFWRVRGHFSEGQRCLAAAMAATPHAALPLRAKAHWGAALLTVVLGRYADAMPLAEESLRLFSEANDVQGVGRALLVMGNCSLFLRGGPNGLALLQRSVALARDVGDDWCLAQGLGLCGWAHNMHGDAEAARTMLEECVAVASTSGNIQGHAFGLNALGYVALGQGDYRSAESLLQDGLALARRLGESYDTAAMLTDLARVRLGRGEYGRTRPLLEEALDVARETGSPDAIAYPLEALGTLAYHEGRLKAARRWFEEALTVVQQAGGTVPPALQGLGEVALAEGDGPRARALLNEALALAGDVGDKLMRARALLSLGTLAASQGDHAAAGRLVQESLSLHDEVGNRPGIATCLEALGTLAASARQWERAARLLAAGQSLRDVDAAARPHHVQRAFDRGVVSVRQALRREQFQAGWAEGAAMSPQQAVAYAAKRPRARGRRPSSGLASLTDAEQGVAVLAAAGLTNRQIGERLFISLGTVKAHLSHVYSKLGISSRVELATEVSRTPVQEGSSQK